MTTAKTTLVLNRSITVRDLIDELSCMNPEAKVLIVSDYGDIGHTQQALPIQTIDELANHEFLTDNAGYSNSGVEVLEIDDEDNVETNEHLDDEDDLRNVVLIRV